MRAIAHQNDLSDIRTLLSAAGLCYEDLKPEHMEHFLCLHQNGELIGAVGLEVFGGDALLRSLVVSPNHRGKRLGIHLVDGIEEHAEDAEITTLYLLTTTADRFFAQRGYVTIERHAVPEAIGQTTEFVSFCPDSAVCMRKTLG